MAVLGASGGGGGGAITNFPITFSSSTTWACPVVMEAYVFVIGGGGAGGGGEITSTFRCQGGAAGGCVVSKLTLEALSKLRKYRELKKSENLERRKLASLMYSKAGGEDSGPSL